MLLLRSYAFRNVGGRADDLDEFSIVGIARVADRSDILQGAIRENEPVLERVLAFLVNCLLELVVRPDAILRMNALQPSFPAGGALQRIEPPESIESFRPIDRIRCAGRNGAAQIQPFRVGDVERKGAAQIQPFRFGKISFAAPQPLFRLLVLGKVSAHTVIAYETSRLVEYRHPRDGQESPAAVGCRPHDLEISERLVGIKGLAVLAPRVGVRLEVRHFPASFADFGERLLGAS